MSNNAGLFAGEVTNLAPQDNVATSKPFGYVWMEYGEPAPAPPLPYDPDMMRFVSGAYSDFGVASIGTGETVVARIRVAPKTGGSFRTISNTYSATTSPGDSRLKLTIIDDNNTGFSDAQNKIMMTVSDVDDGIGAPKLCRLVSNVTVTDLAKHVLFASYDSLTGNATFYIDGVDADDLGSTYRVAPTAGTTFTADPIEHHVGGEDETTYSFDDWIGFYGYKDEYLSNPLDFMTGATPIDIDTVTWTEWNGQPRFWNEFAKMDESLGTEGAMILTPVINGPE